MHFPLPHLLSQAERGTAAAGPPARRGAAGVRGCGRARPRRRGAAGARGRRRARGYGKARRRGAAGARGCGNAGSPACRDAACGGRHGRGPRRALGLGGRTAGGSQH